MSIDQRLRDAAPSETTNRHHAQRLREQVTSQFVDDAGARGPRSTLVRASIAASVSAALLSVGGLAYASGVLPDLLADTITEANPQDAPVMTQVVDLPLPEGGRFAAWRGQSESQFCTASTDGWDDDQASEGVLGSVSCFDATPESVDLNRVQVTWAAGSERDADGRPETWYPVVFGDTNTEAAQVRITGTFSGTAEPVDTVVDLDATSSAFGLVLPGSSDNPWATAGEGGLDPKAGLRLTFLDASGAVIGSRGV